MNNKINFNTHNRSIRQILIAEDNDNNYCILKEVLELLGYKDIDWAKNAEDAVNQTRNKAYDLILMDRMMPVMDGVEAIEQLQKENYKGMIIIISGLSPDSNIKHLPIQGYIKKPFRIDDIVNLIGSNHVEF